MHRRVWQLGWISFFADVSSEMAYPALPLFMNNVLKAPVAAIGLVEGVAEALVSIMKGLSGIHSDRTGRRTPYLRWGYGLSALGKPMIALAHAWPMVMVARVTDRLGKGVRTTARDALIADTVEAARRGEAFGLHRAMDTAGALVGVGLALVLLSWMPEGYRLLFLLAAIPGAISVALTFRLSEASPQGPERAETEKAPAPVSLRELPRGYWRALGLACVFALGNSSDTFLLLRAQDLGFSAAAAIGAYALYNVTYALLSRPMGVLSDRLGRWRVLGAGWLVYAGVYVGFALLGPHAVWPLFAVYGVYMGFTGGVGKALVADHAPPGSRGTALGFFYLTMGFATLVSSVVAGILWDQIGAAAPFWFGATCALAAAALIPLTRPRAMV